MREILFYGGKNDRETISFEREQHKCAHRGDRRIDNLYDDGVHIGSQPDNAFGSGNGQHSRADRNLSGFFCGNHGNGTFSKLSICSGTGNGIECLFCIHSMWQYGVFLESGIDVFVEGIVFIVLSLTNVREAIFNAIPSTLKKGVSAGIGLFIAFIGLQGAHLVVSNSSTLVTYCDFAGNWHTQGICAVLALIGLIITVILYIKGFKGAILIGILVTWILGMLSQVLGIYQVNVKEGFYSLYPSMHMTDFSKIGETFGQCFKADFHGVGILNFIIVLCSFLFVDMFDTIGTLVGVSSKAGMLDENEKLPNIKPALLADAIATSAGAVIGTSTTTTYVESSAGVGAGGRTGLASAVTAIMFLLAIFFAPVFTAVPGFATAPALIFVGFLMLSAVVDIDFNDLTEAVPAYLTILAMPLMYSIAEGISIGIISYVVINLLCGKHKKNTVLMYVLAVLFICKYIFL